MRVPILDSEGVEVGALILHAERAEAAFCREAQGGTVSLASKIETTGNGVYCRSLTLTGVEAEAKPAAKSDPVSEIPAAESTEPAKEPSDAGAASDPVPDAPAGQLDTAAVPPQG